MHTFVWLAVLCIGSVVRLQQPAAAPRAVPVMILGTYHFANPNLDLVQTDFDDHTSERRQREIQEVCDLLARFAPTKIALEASNDEALQRDFEAYVRGERELGVNESEQLGMRLAKRLGHARVFGIDHPMGLDLDAVTGPRSAAAIPRCSRTWAAPWNELVQADPRLELVEPLEFL
jgi:hypothetical protein